MGNYNDILQAAREFLKSHGIADADADAWYLLAHVTGMNRADFFMHREELLPGGTDHKYRELLKMRARHIPLQYLTRTQEFMGLEFDVNEHVLIPRQDTECLVEEVLKVCNKKSILDVGTGSGCIIVSLAKLGNISRATASDLSGIALETARNNARKHHVEVEFIVSDLFEKIEGYYDIIVSNPPYIRTEDIKTLMPEVRDHEPVTALDAGADGLTFYRRIIDGLPSHLLSGGMVFFEIGHDQGAAVKELLVGEGYIDIHVNKDLSGLDRVVCAVRS